MTLFGGTSPQFDLATAPDCMSPMVHAELLHGYDVNEAEDQTATAAGQFAWLCLFSNFALVVDLSAPEP